MMRETIRMTRVLALLLALGGMAACTAEQTQPAEAPDVDVDVDPGRWPEFNVNWADVDVGTTERTITVPVVTVTKEERQVSVPFIDINPPGDAEREERTISMELDVPHGGMGLQITEVHAANNTLWVVARLTDSGQPATQAVTRVADHVVVNAPDNVNVRKIVVGDRPAGVYNQQYRFVSSLDQVNIPAQARVIYRRG